MLGKVLSKRLVSNSGSVGRSRALAWGKTNVPTKPRPPQNVFGYPTCKLDPMDQSIVDMLNKMWSEPGIGGDIRLSFAETPKHYCIEAGKYLLMIQKYCTNKIGFVRHAWYRKKKYLCKC